jgi:hypothetical protein
MEIEDVVMQLIGPVFPIGKTHIDDKRLENLKSLCELFYGLFTTLENVALYRDRQEYSMKRAGQHAHGVLSTIGKQIHNDKLIESPNFMGTCKRPKAKEE